MDDNLTKTVNSQRKIKFSEVDCTALIEEKQEMHLNKILANSMAANANNKQQSQMSVSKVSSKSKVTKNDKASLANSIFNMVKNTSGHTLRIRRIIKFLQTPPANRSTAQIDEIIEDYKESGFFKKIYKKKTDHEKIRRILKCLSYKFLNKNDCLFRYNETPDCAYIVFQGGVSVFIPKSEDQIKKELADPTLVRNNYHISGMDLKKYKKDEHFYDMKTGLMKFNAVCTLGEGSLFGEIGILNARPRTATIMGRTN